MSTVITFMSCFVTSFVTSETIYHGNNKIKRNFTLLKWIPLFFSSREIKTFKFSLVLCTRDKTDVFITLDENISGIQSKRVCIHCISRFLLVTWTFRWCYIGATALLNANTYVLVVRSGVSACDGRKTSPFLYFTMVYLSFWSFVVI